jgi:adenine specific DNA methylase Mod
LQESYLSKVKMIYIDPPYNTGKDFVYRDDFRMSPDEYEEAAGIYDEGKQQVSAEYRKQWSVSFRLVLSAFFETSISAESADQ